MAEAVIIKYTSELYESNAIYQNLTVIIKWILTSPIS